MAVMRHILLFISGDNDLGTCNLLKRGSNNDLIYTFQEKKHPDNKYVF